MVKFSLLIALTAVSLASADLQRNGFPLLGAMSPRAEHLQKRFPLGDTELSLEKRCDSYGLACSKNSADCCEGSCAKDCSSGQFMCGGECGGTVHHS